MAQQYSQIVDPNAVFASNVGAVSGATETIVLDAIPCLGLKSIGVTIVNIGATNAISAVKLYGSPDGINYVAITGLTSFTVAANGGVGHGETTAIFQYLRVTTTGATTINAYLYAVI